MAKKLYEESSVQAIANAIREKNGGTDTYKIGAMAAAIKALPNEDNIAHGDIPSYVKTEALAVAEKVKTVLKDDSIVFLAISDLHHAGEQADGWQANINAGNLHACQALKALAYILPGIDFGCVLGDITFGNASTTPALLKSQIAEINGWLDEAYKGIPQFRTVGNHDTGEYSTLVGAEYLYSAIGKYCEGAVYGSTEYGYCYRDFESKKLRVICLNRRGHGKLHLLSGAAAVVCPDALRRGQQDRRGKLECAGAGALSTGLRRYISHEQYRQGVCGGRYDHRERHNRQFQWA